MRHPFPMTRRISHIALFAVALCCAEKSLAANDAITPADACQSILGSPSDAWRMDLLTDYPDRSFNNDRCTDLLEALENPRAIQGFVRPWVRTGERGTDTDAAHVVAILDHALSTPHARAALARFLINNRGYGWNTSSAVQYVEDVKRLFQRIVADPDGFAERIKASYLDPDLNHFFRSTALLNDLRALFGLDYDMNESVFASLVDLPLRHVQDQFLAWTATFRMYAQYLMWVLLALGFVMAGWGMIFGDLEPGKFASTMVQMVIMASLFYALLSPMPWAKQGEPWIAEMAEELVVAFGGGVRDQICDPENPLQLSGTDSLCDSEGSAEFKKISPGFIVTRGMRKGLELIEVAVNVYSRSSGFIQSLQVIPMYLIGAFCFLIVSILYFLMAVMVTLVWIEGYAVISLGLFLLAFGVVREFRDKAMGYIWYIVGWAVRISAMMMVYFFIDTAFEDALASNIQIATIRGQLGEGELEGSYIIPYLLFCIVTIMVPFFTTVMMNSIPNTLSGMVGGGSSSVGGNIVNMSSRVASMASVAVAAKGAKAIFGGIGTGASAVGGGMTRGGADFADAKEEGATRWESFKSGARATFGRRSPEDVANSRGLE